ncbi:MAG: hypothetical protein AAF197_00870 [Pseudomonadota bacterium]
MKTKSTSELPLCYWSEEPSWSGLPALEAHRYLIFDSDQGGLNNIRLVFDHAVSVAIATGRTLVIPPTTAMYLINHGPMPEEHKGGHTDYADLFDLNTLAERIPLLTTPEFIDASAQHLNIPIELRELARNDQKIERFTALWKNWVAHNAAILDWNPYKKLVCHPSIAHARGGPHFEESYVDDREAVELSPAQQAAPVLYLPSNKSYRSLGPVATMFACKDDELPRLARRVLKYHMRYHPDIYVLADEILSGFGLGKNGTNCLCQFDAIQVRRNDFQYSETRLGMATIADNIRALFDQDLAVYVATDEQDAAVLAELAAELQVPRLLSWADIDEEIKTKIPYAWIGPIEQLICSAARRFVGTDLSTFTSYIHRVRGYLNKGDTNLYYHSIHYEGPDGESSKLRFRGRDYLRENPLFWESC